MSERIAGTGEVSKPYTEGSGSDRCPLTGCVWGFAIMGALLGLGILVAELVGWLFGR